MIRLHNMNKTHTFIDVESGQFISLPKDETDKPPVNADINGLQFFGKSTQDGEPAPDNPVDLVSIPPEFNLMACGRNLIKFTDTNLSYTINNVTVAYDTSSGIFSFDGAATESGDVYFNVHPQQLFKGQDFTLKAEIIDKPAGISVPGSYTIMRRFTWDYRPFVLYDTTQTLKSATLSQDFYFNTIHFYLTKGYNYTGLKLRLWFVRGTYTAETMPPYQPYQGSTYPYRLEDLDGNLHEAGDLPDGTADTYNRETGQFVERKGVKVLDGTENWRAETTLDTATRVGFGVSLPYYTYDSSTYSKITHYRNTHFTKSATPLTENLSSNVCRLTDMFYVAISKTLATDLATFKTWLAGQYSAGTPVTVQYALAEPVTYQIKQYGETYDGQVWDKNEKPKSIQYHTNIFTDVGAEMQCEVRKLGNRKMSEFYWVTENGDKIITEDGDYIMFEY